MPETHATDMCAADAPSCVSRVSTSPSRFLPRSLTDAPTSRTRVWLRVMLGVTCRSYVTVHSTMQLRTRTRGGFRQGERGQAHKNPGATNSCCLAMGLPGETGSSDDAQWHGETTSRLAVERNQRACDHRFLR